MLNVLVGAHGTGKSTLLRELKGKIPYYVTDGFSRPISESFKGYGFKDEKDFHQDLINTISEWAWDNYLDQNVISARSLVDVIVYSKYFFPDWSYELVIAKFQESKEKVNFFYIPIEFDLSEDGVRFSDKKQQVEINRLLKLFLEDQRINFITLSGSVEERLVQLKSNLR